MIGHKGKPPSENIQPHVHVHLPTVPNYMYTVCKFPMPTSHWTDRHMATTIKRISIFNTSLTAQIRLRQHRERDAWGVQGNEKEKFEGVG